MEFNIVHEVILYGFVVALVMGALVNKTNFCTMGAVSDWVNMGKKGRLYAWLFAISIALAGALILEVMGVLSLSSTLPPYRTANFAWLRYLLGGFMFGIGMTLAGGCGNKTLVNIGGGNLKSLFVLVVLAYFAYLMTKTEFYAVAFHGWINYVTIDLAVHGIESQSLSHIMAGLFGLEDNKTLHLILGAAMVLGILWLILRSQQFYKNFNNVLGGLAVGLAVLACWYITGGSMGQEAMEVADFMDEPPEGVGVQSYTFISPAGAILHYLNYPTDYSLITLGMMAIVGVIVGSLLYALISRRFSFVWFSSWSDFFKHLIGGILMGIGGVLSMGCTIGEGITGVSTLALGSMLVVVSIVFGSALTMKIQMYKMCYEDAGIIEVIQTALVDLRLLPKSMRKLEEV